MVNRFANLDNSHPAVDVAELNPEETEDVLFKQVDPPRPPFQMRRNKILA